jgi:peroxiredoxin
MESFLTNRYAIDPRLAASIRRHAPQASPDERSPWNAILEHVTNNPPFLLTQDLDALARATNGGLVLVVRQLSRHSNVVVRFCALLGLAAGGDRVSAAALLDLARQKAQTPTEVTTVKNLYHGIGIDPTQDTPRDVLDFLKSAMHQDDTGRPELGTPAPDFEIRNLAGQPVRLSNYRGKVVLMHFWSRTCGPCLAEFPELKNALGDLRAQTNDFVVIGVNLDDDLAAIQKTVKQYELDWVHVCDGRGWGSKPARLFKIFSLPSDVVIDAQGIVRSYRRDTLPGILRRTEPKSPR